MKKIELPTLEREAAVTFEGIPAEQFSQKLNELDKTLHKKMRKNGIRESQSIRFAASFISTPPMDDE